MGRSLICGFEMDPALRHNVRIVYGVDLEPELAGREFAVLVRYGVTPLQAIQAATINAASRPSTRKSKGTTNAVPEVDHLLQPHALLSRTGFSRRVARLSRLVGPLCRRT